MSHTLKRNLFKNIVLILLFVVLFASIFFSLFAISATSTARFDKNKIFPTNLYTTMLDYNQNPIYNDMQIKKIKLVELPKYVPQAFIAIEDKQFYNHSGINTKRMVKAMIENILSGRRKQGASTISQQLIKNTHLSSEKTLVRKLKEIKLALDMEKQVSKDEILECYLNEIYYGSGCYGIAEASHFYFSCEPKDLSLSDAALLAGIIKAPGLYSPINQPENALKRRNLVLSQMEKDSYISSETTKSEQKKPLQLKISNIEDSYNPYMREALREAEKILGLTKQQIASQHLKIFTYYENNKQQALKQALMNESPTTDYNAISISNETGGVSAYVSNFSYPLEQTKRQPGSAIKPVMVYGPAIEKNIISPITQILDEPISFDGYSPQNITKTFDGFVSAKDALARSLNVPAVKVMNYVGIETCKSYAKDLGIPFEEQDKGYALALGGFTTGTNLLQLTSSYLPFSNQGNYWQVRFIDKIEDEHGNIIYQNYHPKKQIFRADTAYLMSDMLNTKHKHTTAKTLGTLPFDTYAKTGTVGTKNGQQNLDANCVSYTSQDTVGVWMGKLDNTPMTNYITGGRQPANAITSYYKQIYSDQPPKSFEQPSSVVQEKIDRMELEQNHQVMLANSFIPERFTQTELFSAFFLPKQKSERFTKIETPELFGKVEGNQAKLYFNAEPYFEYEIIKTVNDKNISIAKYETSSGKTEFSMPIIDGEVACFTLQITLKNHSTNEVLTAKSKPLNLMKSKTSSPEQTAKQKWFL